MSTLDTAAAAGVTGHYRKTVFIITPTIFLSAFLLFWFEPMVGKMMLPLLGGAAAVWITCLLFFQLMLLAGYGYAYVLERYANVRTQIVVHAIMLAAVLFFLPIHFGARPDEAASAHPSAWLLWQLIKTAGFPFCIVSTTAPLLQNWFSKTPAVSGRDPYFLYAVSNAGSLIALLTYPLIVEPAVGVRNQSWWWGAGFVVLGLLVATVSIIVWKTASDESRVFDDVTADVPVWRTRVFWLAAAFVPSALMLAVTNHILLNLASVPFLWILPLAVYLITFMIAFGRRIHLSIELVSALVAVTLLLLFPFAATNRAVEAKYLLFIVAVPVLLAAIGFWPWRK